MDQQNQTNPADKPETTTNPAPQDSAILGSQTGRDMSKGPAFSGRDTTKPRSEPEQSHPRKRLVRIVDTTAVHGPRTHEQVVNGRIQAFTFKPHEPLELPPEVATKFLRLAEFRMVNDQGEFVEYKRQPKQPEELGAGEKFVLAENETIARYDELSSPSLLQRAAELPGGEAFLQRPEKPSRDELVAFLIKTVAAKRAATRSKEADLKDDEFIPEPETDDEA